MTELAYSYAVVARILNEKNWRNYQIAEFLKKHQNPSGYIKASLLPD